MKKQNKCPDKYTKKVSFVTQSVAIVGNVFLSVLKLTAGIISHSGALISDAANSISDIFASLIVLIGIQMSVKEPDSDHPYGHERLESIAAIIVAVIILATGFGIGYDGVKKVFSGLEDGFITPGKFALIAAAISIVIKEFLFWYTRHGAKKIKSNALFADAWNHRSDTLASLGGFIGILGARLGFPILDPVASLVICLFILRTGFSIAKEAVSKLTDRACDREIIDRMEEIILSQPGVCRLDSLFTRQFGSNKIYADVEISAQGDISLTLAHSIAELVHDELEKQIPEIKHCTVHVNPLDIN